MAKVTKVLDGCTFETESGQRVRLADVKRVIDGDTFETESGQRVRLANVNAPEVGKPRAAKATAKLRDLVDGKNVRIDPVGISYGRVVADVTVGVGVSRKSVNSTMRRSISRTK